MPMGDLYVRIVDSLISLMNSAGQIDILEVQEESLIEKSTVEQSLLPHEHETTG